MWRYRSDERKREKLIRTVCSDFAVFNTSVRQVIILMDINLLCVMDLRQLVGACRLLAQVMAIFTLRWWCLEFPVEGGRQNSFEG